MSTTDDIARVVDGFYAAAASEVGWDVALERLLDVTGFDGGALYLFDRTTTTFDATTERLVRGLWHRLSTDGQADYENHYFKIDPRINYLIDKPDTRILYDYLHTSEDQIDNSEYYDWYQKNQGTRYYLGGHTSSALPYWGGITLHRRAGLGPPAPEDIERFSSLFNHLERALGLDYRLSLGQANSEAIDGLVEGNPTGIVLLDKGGNTVFANRAARDMATRNDAFAIERDGVRALRNGDGKSLQALIAEAAEQAVGPAPGQTGVLRLTRRSGKRDYVIVVARLPRRYGVFAPWAAAICLLIFDPDARPELPQDLLQRVYGLTTAEARIAVKLLSCGTLEAAAKDLGVAITTARFHLASVFRKTGTERQTDLIRLLMSIPWPAINSNGQIPGA
jgi:DNA-binding CsgD family transcriptional regulator